MNKPDTDELEIARSFYEALQLTYPHIIEVVEELVRRGQTPDQIATGLSSAPRELRSYVRAAALYLANK